MMTAPLLANARFAQPKRESARMATKRAMHAVAAALLLPPSAFSSHNPRMMTAMSKLVAARWVDTSLALRVTRSHTSTNVKIRVRWANPFFMTAAPVQ